MIIRPVTPDRPWDQCDDLVARAFGPRGAALIRPRFEPVVAGGRCRGAFGGGRPPGGDPAPVLIHG